MFHNRGNARRGQDTGCFLENFTDCVLPYLRPFPEPCSVVVLDNSRCGSWAGSRRVGIAPLLIVPVRCRSLHHDDRGALEYLVSMRGARLHYLPPCVDAAPLQPPIRQLPPAALRHSRGRPCRAPPPDGGPRCSAGTRRS